MAVTAATASPNPARMSSMATSVPWILVGPATSAEWRCRPALNRQPTPAEAVVEGLDDGAHVVELLRVAESVLEDRLMHRRHAVGLGERRDQRRLPVGGEPRVGGSGDRDRSQPCGGFCFDAAVGVDSDRRSEAPQQRDRGRQAARVTAHDRYLALGRDPGHEVRERLHAVACDRAGGWAADTPRRL